MTNDDSCLSDSVVECCNCGRTTHLIMCAHRKNKRIVGWLFICTGCAPSLAGKELEFRFSEGEEKKEVGLI